MPRMKRVSVAVRAHVCQAMWETLHTFTASRTASWAPFFKGENRLSKSPNLHSKLELELGVSIRELHSSGTGGEGRALGEMISHTLLHAYCLVLKCVHIEFSLDLRNSDVFTPVSSSPFANEETKSLDKALLKHPQGARILLASFLLTGHFR